MNTLPRVVNLDTMATMADITTDCKNLLRLGGPSCRQEDVVGPGGRRLTYFAPRFYFLSQSIIIHNTSNHSRYFTEHPVILGRGGEIWNGRQIFRHKKCLPCQAWPKNCSKSRMRTGVFSGKAAAWPPASPAPSCLNNFTLWTSLPPAAFISTYLVQKWKGNVRLFGSVKLPLGMAYYTCNEEGIPQGVT